MNVMMINNIWTKFVIKCFKKNVWMSTENILVVANLIYVLHISYLSLLIVQHVTVLLNTSWIVQIQSSRNTIVPKKQTLESQTPSTISYHWAAHFQHFLIKCCWRVQLSQVWVQIWQFGDQISKYVPPPQFPCTRLIKPGSNKLDLCH